MNDAMHILILDNYDSFTYNLAQYAQMAGAQVSVRLNDAVTVNEIKEMNPDGIIISPGPGTPLVPEDVGVCSDVLCAFEDTCPILGVCLGHQLMGHLYGAKITRTEPKHGEASLVFHDETSPIFEGILSPFEAMRYHSLIIKTGTLPPELRPTTHTKDGTIMALQHTQKPLFGVQFHPESIGTNTGQKILKNFVNICASYPSSHA